jgi:erythromycin esterase-like protein
MDSLLSLCIYGDRYQREVLRPAEGADLQAAIKRIASRVLPQLQGKEAFDLLELCFTNRLHLAAYLQLPTNQRYQQRIQFRDSIMAENIKSFRQLMPKKPVVIWAANLHIGKKGIMGKKWTKDGVKSMAAHLEPDWSVYRIAISAKRGKTAAYFDQVILTPEKVLVAPKYLTDPCH